MRRLLHLLIAFGVTTMAAARPVHGPVAHGAATHRSGDFTKSYFTTPAGGIVKGNPQAPVELVEYFSPACPHCKHFAEVSHAGLNDMIASGKLSFEMRPLLLGYPHEPALDILIRCGTPAQGFALTDSFFAQQDAIFARLEPTFKANLEQWKKLPVTAAYSDIADKLGLVALAQQVGVTPARAHACLADKRNYDVLEGVTKAAEQLHIARTPSFLLNDSPVATSLTEDPWVGVKRVLDATLPGIVWPPTSPNKKGVS